MPIGVDVSADHLANCRQQPCLRISCWSHSPLRVCVSQMGDEHWRISAADRTVDLVDTGKNRTCTVSVMDGKTLTAPTECTDLDLALAAFPSFELCGYTYRNPASLATILPRLTSVTARYLVPTISGG